MADAQDTRGDERLHGPLPRPLTYVSSQDKFKASWSTPLTTAGACEQLERLSDCQVTSLVQDIRRILAELVRLSSVDTSLSRERVFVANLEAGVEHSMLGGRADVAAMFVHDELMSTSEEGRRVNMSEVVKKLSNITRFLQGPKGSGRAAIPWAVPSVAPVALTQHFQPPGPQPAWNPAPSFHPGVQGQYAPVRSRARSTGGRGGGGRGVGRPLCNARNSGKRRCRYCALVQEPSACCMSWLRSERPCSPFLSDQPLNVCRPRGWPRNMSLLRSGFRSVVGFPEISAVVYPPLPGGVL
ncbi:unnamed protein product [Pylaiella littoralis]